MQQAAAQVEHTVVRGNNTLGSNVSTTVVTHGSDEQLLGVPEIMNDEHHNDPPDPLNDSMDEDPSSSDTRDNPFAPPRRMQWSNMAATQQW
nr:uncharacterized protein LOC109162703 [Ipomoea batatas]